MLRAGKKLSAPISQFRTQQDVRVGDGKRMNLHSRLNGQTVNQQTLSAIFRQSQHAQAAADIAGPMNGQLRLG